MYIYIYFNCVKRNSELGTEDKKFLVPTSPETFGLENIQQNLGQTHFFLRFRRKGKNWDVKPRVKRLQQ